MLKAIIVDGSAVARGLLNTVLTDGGVPLGWLLLNDARYAGRTYVERVTVDEASRGRGYGRWLMRHAERHALCRGVPIVGLTVWAPEPRRARPLREPRVPHGRPVLLPTHRHSLIR